jgi:hypothetical protein
MSHERTSSNAPALDRAVVPQAAPAFPTLIQVDAGDPMTTDNLREEIVSALKRGAPYDDLLAIVLHHKARGASQKATYAALESARMEMGCNDAAGENNPLCAGLEDIMDRVWGFCPQSDAIWESSMSEVHGE